MGFKVVQRTRDCLIREDPGGGHGLSESKIIVLEVRHPDVPSIDLVDLPSLSNDASRKEEVDRIIDLQIQSDKANTDMYLAVVRGAQRPNTDRTIDFLDQRGLGWIPASSLKPVSFDLEWSPCPPLPAIVESKRNKEAWRQATQPAVEVLATQLQDVRPHLRLPRRPGPALRPLQRIVRGVRGADLQVRFIEEAAPLGSHIIVADDNIMQLVVEHHPKANRSLVHLDGPEVCSELGGLLCLQMPTCQRKPRPQSLFSWPHH